MKIFFRRIHLYLGISTGLVVMITCLTGAILVYEKEMQHGLHPKRYFNHTVSTERIPADSLINLVESTLQVKAKSIKIYEDPRRNTEITIPSNSATTVKIPGNRPPTETVFINPCTGDIAAVYNHRESFFFMVMNLHRWMLGGETGKWIVGTSTLLFLFILITGIILWWPKNKAMLWQRLKWKPGTGFKRMNYDYHVVLGFYSAIILFILAGTGLAWSFEWFNKGIYTLTGTQMVQSKPIAIETGKPVYGAVELALRTVKQQAASPYYQITLPSKPQQPISIAALQPHYHTDVEKDVYNVNPYTNQVVSVEKYNDKNTGQKVRAQFKPVHTASVFGQPSKFIGFVACLLGTFFPASGIIIWWNRTRKKRMAKK
ncbi:MAG: PepSY domain-containing protein [Ferruginibacter sp.]|nr:PepSY domain-containing protein [Ferruginibacter sp.]